MGRAVTAEDILKFSLGRHEGSPPFQRDTLIFPRVTPAAPGLPKKM